MDANTTSLRSAAPQWSLAGDKQLLDILQNIHQSLVTRCQEVNRKLDEMVLALDGASVDLQNVNNKFMALSNTQFIESRVYDDDVDIAAQEPPKEVPKAPSSESEVLLLKRSIAHVAAAHDTLEILASDSDDDEDARMVLKPKDMYAHRPLPYVIGSQAWRNKWHAGLHPEDSDSDSSMSKQDRENEEFSDSEPEMTISQPARVQHEREESTASSELPSEQDIGSVPAATIKPSPSDIAAELARRLGGQTAQIPVQEPEYSPPNPTTRKVYRVEQPTPGTIFSDEPPPLDCQIEQDDDTPEEDDDIFAELHKNKPYSNSNKDQTRTAEELFSGLREEYDGDVFSDFKDTQSSTPANQKSTLFEGDSEPELFAERQVKSAPTQDTTRPEVENVKKPIGGISLFGNTRGAESIGAAILRRNRRTSSSDDETNDETPKEPETASNKQEKDIFDDLFAKSEKEQKKNAKKIEEKIKKEVEKPKAKVDLFSDNIFDDIDDIFTTNVNTMKKDTDNKKTLFGDDEDLFSDVAVTKNSKVDSKSVADKNKSIFDSDDDLFSENTAKKPESKPAKEVAKPGNTRSSVLEDEIDDLFTKPRVKNDTTVDDVTREVTNNKMLNNDRNKTKIDNNLNDLNETEAATNMHTSDKSKTAAKSIFDDDDENDDLFGSTTTKSSISEQNTLSNSQTQSFKSKDQKSSLFEDVSDDDDDLFGTKLPEDKENKNSINNSDNTRNNTIEANPIENPSVFNDEETDNLFTNTTKQENVNNENNRSINRERNESITNKPKKESDTEIQNKQSLFDDEEESIFESKNPVNTKPKPDILRKPTAASRNNNNMAKLLDNDKNVQDTNDNIKSIQQAPNITPSIVKDNAEVTSKWAEKDPLTTSDDKITMEKEDTKSKSLKTEQNTNSTNKMNPEPTEEKESKLPGEIQSSNDKVDSFLPETDLEIPPPMDTVDDLKDDDIFADQLNDDPTTSDPVFTPNVFDDIFSEPPAFEKSKEPKRSKNINALFDDDSEDEALFFKKNEPVVDEKPELGPEVNRDALFGIFHDEPPAIDVDFTQKPTKSNVNDDFLNTDSDDDLFSTPKAVTSDTVVKSSENVPKLPTLDLKTEKLAPKEETASNKEKPSISDPKPHIIDKPKPLSKESQKDTTDGEPKKVGKLKTMNFNIDVSTLLPGASPKKKALDQIDTKSTDDLLKKEIKKSLEQTDGQIFTKSSEDLHSKEKIEPVMVKSVSFEGEPDSQVLDNKISKERAKIQVKRRPSTRRARKEAVRKSGIDFGDDSTDNSSSIDDVSKGIAKVDTQIDDYKEPESLKEVNIDFEDSISKFDDLDTLKTDIETQLSKTSEILAKSEELPSLEVKFETDLERSTDIVDSKIKGEEKSDNFEPKTEDSNKNLSETVKDKEISGHFEHITPDSNKNLFETVKDKEIPGLFEPKTQDSNKTLVENTTDTPKDNSATDSKAEVKDTDTESPTQVEIKAEPKLESPKTVTSKIVYILNDEDIFSAPAETKPPRMDIDDDGLFKNTGNSSKNTEEVANISTLGNAYKEAQPKTTIDKKGDNKKSLFDDLSDDDDELFNKNKKVATKQKSILDSDSEEDLFGARKGKQDTKAVVSEMKDTKAVKDVKRVKVKSSLFGDEDDDDDLFGAKVKSNPATTAQPTRSAREVSTKTAEPVFDDPLSMLGDNDD